MHAHIVPICLYNLCFRPSGIDDVDLVHAISSSTCTYSTHMPHFRKYVIHTDPNLACHNQLIILKTCLHTTMLANQQTCNVNQHMCMHIYISCTHVLAIGADHQGPKYAMGTCLRLPKTIIRPHLDRKSESFCTHISANAPHTRHGGPVSSTDPPFPCEMAKKLHRRIAPSSTSTKIIFPT